MSTVAVITERVHAPFDGCRVDREAGVVTGVRVCGATSKNGNDYDRGAFGDGRLYEGRHVYVNHDYGARERRAEDKVGWLANVSLRPDGTPQADFHVIKSHPMAASVLEAAERNPSLYGFSHVARCRFAAGAGGRKRVEAVEAVASIDLVSTPATTGGLFESAGGRPVSTTFGQLVESIEPRLGADRRRAARRWLVEMDGDPMLDAPAGPEPAADADPDEALWSGFSAAILAILDQYKSGGMDAAAAAKEVGRYVKGHARLTGNGKSDDDKGGGEKPADDKAAESARLRAENDRLTREVAAARLAAERGVKLSEAQARALARCDDDAERKALLESFAPRPAERPVAAGRTTAAELLRESGGKAGARGKGKLVWDADRGRLVEQN